MKSLLSVEQLSVCIHKSVASIRSDSTRNPQSLPSICRLPGTKRLLWRVEDVENWLAKYVLPAKVAPESAPAHPQTPAALAPTPRRGRPRNNTARTDSQSLLNPATSAPSPLAAR